MSIDQIIKEALEMLFQKMKFPDCIVNIKEREWRMYDEIWLPLHIEKKINEVIVWEKREFYVCYLCG